MYTFFTSRPAIMLPCVERRSPAMTTPPGNFNATIVVPCGSAPNGAGSPLAELVTGSSSGACRRSSSEKDDKSTGTEGAPARCEG